MQLGEFQELIRRTYFVRDKARGVDKTFLWFVEEVGELAERVREGTKEQMEEEVADVLAWLTTVAELKGISLEKAIDRYRNGCPACRSIPCKCPPR